MRKIFRKNYLIVALILFLGLILRLYNLSEVPLYGDELTIVYDVYSIIKTGGFDQTGEFLPITFSMGAGRPAGYVYGSIPFVLLFGPNEWGVRGLSIISGLGVILVLFFLGRYLFNEKVGLIAAFLAAVNPWELSLSRGGFEAHFALLLSLLGFYLFSLAKNNPKFYILSALSFGLTFHTYPTYKIVLPVFFVLLIWYTKGIKSILESINKKWVFAGLIILGLFVATSLTQTFFANSEVRFGNINIFSKEDLREQIIQRVNFERNLNPLPGIVSLVFHNKFLEYAFIVGENYFKNFSLEFLFLHGDGNPRHNMTAIGGFYLVEMLLIFLGMLIVIGENKKLFIFLSIWIFIAPLPAALIEGPHFLRSAFMLPPLILFSAIGVAKLLENKKRYGRFLKIAVIAIFISQFMFLTNSLYFLSPAKFGNFWAYSAKQATEVALENKDKFDAIFISDRVDNIEFAYPVYAKISPKIVIEQNKKREKVGDFQFKKFDNIYIGSIPEVSIKDFVNSQMGKILYIGPEAEKRVFTLYETLQGSDNLDSIVLYKKL